MTQYVKHHVTKHERDRLALVTTRERDRLAHVRRVAYRMITAAEIEAYSNPVAPPQHDHTAQLDAWADHVARGYIVR